MQVAEALRAAMEEGGAEVVLTRIAPKGLKGQPPFEPFAVAPGADPAEDSGAAAGPPGAQRASSSLDTRSHGSTRVEIHGASPPPPLVLSGHAASLTPY